MDEKAAVLRPVRALGKRALALPLAVMAIGAISCQGPGAQAPLPSRPREIEVVMDEYRFSFDRAVPASRVIFRIVNKGSVPHRLALLPLPEDFPPLDEQLRSPQRRPLPPYAGINNRFPGERGVFAADLPAGTRFGMVCLVIDPDGTSHARQGMSAEFRTQR